MIFAVALFSGLIVGVVVAFLRDWLDTTVHNEQDVAAIVGAPVIGIIPNLRNEALVSRYRSLVAANFRSSPCRPASRGARRRDADDGGGSVPRTAHEPELRESGASRRASS